MVELAKRSIGNFFEDRMATYAEQLSYRGLFGLFPFIILVFALLAVLQLDAVFDRLLDAAMGALPQQIPEPLEPVAKEGRAQTVFLRPLIEQAREQAGGGLLSFGIVLSLWSVSAVAFTLTEALNVAYGVEETRSRRKRFAYALVLGPFLALTFIVACGLMLIGPQVAGWLAELAGLDEAWVALWAWLRFPVALLLLAVMLSIVYRFVPDTDRSFWSATLGALFAVIAWAITSVGSRFTWPTSRIAA
jgi:membrane protein